MKEIGLITIDTYRIGAVEQLKTYAEIMNIPFKVVITLKDMDEAMEEFKDCDVILIDTTGRSSKNTMQISELRAFVDKVKTDNISLVISSTTKNRATTTAQAAIKIKSFFFIFFSFCKNKPLGKLTSDFPQKASLNH